MKRLKKDNWSPREGFFTFSKKDSWAPDKVSPSIQKDTWDSIEGFTFVKKYLAPPRNFHLLIEKIVGHPRRFSILKTDSWDPREGFTFLKDSWDQ